MEEAQVEKENMENARLLLIEKLKESIAAPAFVADTRYTLKLQACHLVNIIDQKSTSVSPTRRPPQELMHTTFDISSESSEEGMYLIEEWF